MQQVVPHHTDDDDDDGGRPERSKGAFHPKICLLFTRRRLVVVISTANLVPQVTADLSWVQSFPRRWHGQEVVKGASDFGKVLGDFMVRIEESLGAQAQQCRRAGEAAAVAEGMVANGPLEFLRRHLGSSDLAGMVRAVRCGRGGG